MNIFVLDLNPKKAAKYHVDRHVIKMIVESAQILCTVKQLNGEIAPYRMTHSNHPCTKWVNKSLSNWHWLHNLAIHLCQEYTSRYRKIHKTSHILNKIEPPNSLIDHGLTPFVQCMPDQYKVPNDPVQSYRNYYLGEKRKFATWKNEIPDWWKV